MESRVQPAIDLRGLRKTYGRGEHALTAVHDVTLERPHGQVFAFLGPNGAGKTTTAKMTAGLLTPSAGEVWINGFHLRRQRAQAVIQLGAVLEGSRNVYWPLSAWQNLLYFGRLKGLGAREIRPRAERLLTELSLWERRHEAVGGFSRGMQQKGGDRRRADHRSSDATAGRAHHRPGRGGCPHRQALGARHLAREEGKTVVLTMTTHQLEIVRELPTGWR